MKKRIISVILSVLLIFCAVLPSVSANDESAHFVVLGDSIAYGSGLLNANAAVYGKVIADTNGYAYENYAIPGHTTKMLLSRMKEPKVKAAIENADIISISIGGNNFLTDNLFGLIFDGIVKEDYSHFDEIAETFAADLEVIIETIRGENAHTAILLQTIYNPQTDEVGEVYRAGADRINAKIVQYAEQHPNDVILVDVAAALTDHNTDFAEDGIHPSAAGNEKIAVAMLKALAENGLGTETVPVINAKGIDVRGSIGLSLAVRIAGKLFHVIAVARNAFWVKLHA